MYRIFLIIALVFTSSYNFAEQPLDEIFSSPAEQIGTYTRTHDFLIGGIVHPLSGLPVLQETDLVARGAQSIALQRTLIPQYTPLNEHSGIIHPSKKSYAGWVYFPQTRLSVFITQKHVGGTDLRPEIVVFAPDENGSVLPFSIENGKTWIKDKHLGISNGLEHPSGQYDPRNTQIKHEGQRLTLKAPDGTTRYYLCHFASALKYDKQHYTAQYHRLQREVLPNGKVIRYSYTENGDLSKVESLDPQERYIYASIDLHYSPFTNQATAVTHTGSQSSFSHQTGRYFKEKYQKRPVDLLYPLHATAMSSPLFRNELLEYDKGSNIAKFELRGYYDQGSYLTNYTGRSTIFRCTYAPFYKKEEKKITQKVDQLFLPAEDSKFDPHYTITYGESSQPHVTTVRQQDGSKTVYRFTCQKLPVSIEYFDQNDVLIKCKTFTWNKRQWLEKVCIADGQKNILSEKHFEYDAFGNPVVEIFKGDLLGDGEIGQAITRRQFSDDGRNLNFKEECSNGKTIVYTYLPKTNLITSHLTKEKELNILREFREYDDCHNLVCIIEDNGSADDINDLSGVTQRKITSYSLRQQQPFLHMPEWICEKYLENGEEKLLKRTYQVYNEEGHVTEQHVYDANNQLAYVLYKTYNEAGDVLSETNPIGQKATYSYDEHSREQSSTTFSQNRCKESAYDLQGRVISVQDRGTDGLSRIESYTYDRYNHLKEKIDHRQQKILYTYDLMAHQPVSVQSPDIVDVNGHLLPVETHYKYDSFGRKVQTTDANGNVTTYRYNAYGSVTEIRYPDQACEIFRYTPDGLLATETDRDGLTTEYSYNIFGKVVSKVFSKENQIIARESFAYRGEHIIRHIDKEGIITEYAYDAAGRLIREDRQGVVKRYSYDPLGGLSTICHENGNNSLYIHLKRDLLGRIIETTKREANGTVLSQIFNSYDGEGNIATIRQEINDVTATESLSYDSFNRKIHHQDGEGNVTTIQYDDRACNSYGQYVLKTTTTDPKRVSTEEMHDAYERLVKREIFNTGRNCIASEEFFYDPCGNLIQHHDHVYHGIEFQKTKKTAYSYDCNHRMSSTIRAYGAVDAREVQFAYSPGGSLTKKTLPDGVVLTYTHDPFGNVQSLISSDHQLHHTFQYNKLGTLLKATDELQHISIERDIDPHGNVLTEKFPSGIVIQKTYDSMNRVQILGLPDGSKITYEYNPLFLKSVTKVSSSGIQLYKHEYDDYDLSGHLKNEHLIGDLGQVTYQTDVKHRLSAINCPYFRQSCRFDELSNLTHQLTNCLASDFTYDELSQVTQDASHHYRYDSTYNRVETDGQSHQHNHLDEHQATKTLACSYDLNGNLTQKNEQTFVYDHLNRLVEAVTPNRKFCFTYDPLGRRIAKTCFHKSEAGWKEGEKEHILYDGENDIGTIAPNGNIKHLRVLGITTNPKSPSAVAIELDGKVYAPIVDCQGNVRSLIDLDQKTPVANYDFSLFGESLHDDQPIMSPWQYQSKRLDLDLKLIDFGKRHYDPVLGRWLSIDPAGFIDSYNLYQYCFNNPSRYTDPDGQFVLMVPLIWGTFELGAALFGTAITLEVTTTAIAGSLIAGTVAWGSYKALTGISRSLESHNHLVFPHKMDAKRKKQGGVDEKLPKDPFNDPNLEDITHPDQAAAGHHEFRNKQTGEKLRFDKGKPTKHGHKANDHYHRPNPNSTGDQDKYLDEKGNPVPKNSDPSHLYRPENVWWI